MNTLRPDGETWRYAEILPELRVELRELGWSLWQFEYDTEMKVEELLGVWFAVTENGIVIEDEEMAAERLATAQG